MDVAFHGRHDDLALALGIFVLLGLNIREKMGHCLFHDAGRFNDLRQEHFARPEQIADNVHAVHQRTFDNFNRPSARLLDGKPRLFGVVHNMRIDPFDQRMLKPLCHRPATPFGFGLFLRNVGAAVFFGKGNQPFGGIGIFVEDNILARNAQFRVYIVIDVELAGVDNCHVQSRRDCVVQEDRMHRPAHRFIATEREGKIRKTARIMGMRTKHAQFFDGFDEVYAVIIMLFDTGRDRKDIRIENNVFRGKADAYQEVISALTDFHLALFGVCLTLFIKGHHDNRGSVGHAQTRMLQELLFTLFHRNGIDDGLTRNAF